jgi:hypothetical protein
VWFFVLDPQLDADPPRQQRSGAAVEEAFVPVLAPGWLDHFIFNEYYKTEDEFLFALAPALGEEYRAVVAAGFVLQIDDPGLPDWWDMLKPEPTVEAYRQFAHRCRQPRAGRHSRGAGALSFVLGQLAWAAHP